MSNAVLTLTAPDIECDGCAASIQRGLGQESGVARVDVAVPTKTITVEYDSAKTNPETLAETLEEIGFPAENH